MPLTVIVLAAGQGKRMHSDLPKVLQPVAGRPMLAHVLQAARGLEPAGICVVYGHGGEKVREAFQEDDLSWALQAEQLGTGHAVLQALPHIPDDHQVLILCGDVPLVRTDTLRRVAEGASRTGFALLTAELADPTGYGRVLRNADGHIARIVEHKDANAEERAVREINTGLMAMNAGQLRTWLAHVGNNNAQGEYYLTDVIALAAADGVPIEPIPAANPSETLGINDRFHLAAAERAYQRLQADALLARGVTLFDPSRIDVRGTVEVGRDVVIDVGVIFVGRVKLGDRVRIGPYSVLIDAEVGDDCVIHTSSLLNGIVAGRGCDIGPFARLRPGTKLADGAKVGNFVEVKNAEIGEGSKANHLTYIGDATVGHGVNIGAGTVTCNYDGANKHRTVIGNGAFIGSGSMLVAPVEIGEGATIGAGSTISKPAPAGELTLARAPQETRKGWKRPQKKPKA